MYVVGGEDLKNHFCSNLYLAQQVVKNLSKRYAEKESSLLSYNSDNQYLFHYPGTVFGETQAIDLAGLTIRFYLIHWPEFKCKIETLNDPLQEERYDGRFFKVHTDNNILCLSLSQKTQLLQDLKKNSEIYDKLAKQQWSRLDNYSVRGLD